MSSVAPVEVERYHVKLIHQMLDVCPAKNAEDIKNSKTNCIMLPKCQTTHIHTPWRKNYSKYHLLHVVKIVEMILESLEYK
jgi:hypothetical protein